MTSSSNHFLGYEVLVKIAGAESWIDFFIPEADIYNPVRFVLSAFAYVVMYIWIIGTPLYRNVWYHL